MASKIISFAAFAALVLAVPQHPEHMGKAQIARSNADLNLAGRAVSFDGSCGSWSGNTCPDGQCCSSDGWCGTSTTHCGTGCQAGFGSCGAPGSGSSPAGGASSAAAPAPPAASASAAAPPASDDGAPTPTPNKQAKTTSQSTTTTTATGQKPGNNAPKEKTSQSQTTEAPKPTTDAAKTTGSGPKPTQTGGAESKSAPAPQASSAPSGGSGGKGADSYKQYSGDGSTGAGWPAMSAWVGDFETMWSANVGIISKSCDQFQVPDNSDEETNDVKAAVQAAAKANGVDPRFALAIMMQESKGCVRVHTTNYGVRNPGLFQDHDGKGTCNDNNKVQTPCPSSEITQMANDGIGGTPAGDGLKQVVAQGGSASDSSSYYKAARIYNSGSIDKSGNLEAGIATHCYASDVANRLTGWVNAASSCTFDKSA